MRPIPVGLVPTLLANRVRRWLGWAQVLRARGGVFRLRDARGSCTLDVVNLEWASGFYEPPLPLRPGDVVLDLGAHVGGFVIPLAKAYRLVRFVCYEPEPGNFAALCANVARARVRNVEVIEGALMDRDGEVDIMRDPSNTGASRVVPGFGVAGATWEAIRERHGLRSIRLLKVDVEGAEHRAFTTRTDWGGVDSLLAEVHGFLGVDLAPTLQVMRRVPVHRLYLEPWAPFVLDSQEV